MRILICGDRDWSDRQLIALIISKLIKACGSDLTVIEGTARGADSIAGELAVKYDLQLEEYPAKWDLYGKGAGPIRNKQMIEEGNPDFVIAFHDDIFKSKGTKNMVTQAGRYGLPSVIISHTEDKFRYNVRKWSFQPPVDLQPRKEID